MPCSICGNKCDKPVHSRYGDICSIECFYILCDDILGANKDDFDEVKED